jgi:Leucine-rich repeat (LRR) protein
MSASQKIPSQIYDLRSELDPTGVVAAAVDRGMVEETSNLKLAKINERMDQCKANCNRYPFRKKLLLDKLYLSSSDIPMKDLCGTSLGNSLYKLSLSGNRFGSIPPKLVMSLPSLRTLDLSQCALHQLPEQFNLPKLKRLNLSNNYLTEFPDEVCCRPSPILVYTPIVAMKPPTNFFVSLLYCRICWKDFRSWKNSTCMAILFL